MYFWYQVQISQSWRSQITETITLSSFKARYTASITLSLEFTLHIFCYRLTRYYRQWNPSTKATSCSPSEQIPQLSQESVSAFTTHTLSPLHSLDHISSHINAILIPTLYVQNKSLQLDLQQSCVRAKRIPMVIQVCLSTGSSISYNPMHNTHK